MDEKHSSDTVERRKSIVECGTSVPAPFWMLFDFIEYSEKRLCNHCMIDSITLKERDCLRILDDGNGADYESLINFCVDLGSRSSLSQLCDSIVVLSQTGKSRLVGFVHLRASVTAVVDLKSHRSSVTNGLDKIKRHSLFTHNTEVYEAFDCFKTPVKGMAVFLCNANCCLLQSKKKDLKFPTNSTRFLISFNFFLSMCKLRPRTMLYLNQRKVETCLMMKSMSHCEINTYHPRILTRPLKIAIGFSDRFEGTFLYHENKIILPCLKLGFDAHLSGNWAVKNLVVVAEPNYLKLAYDKRAFVQCSEFEALTRALTIKVRNFWDVNSHWVQSPLNLAIPDETWKQCTMCLKWRFVDDCDKKSANLDSSEWNCMFIGSYCQSQQDPDAFNLRATAKKNQESAGGTTTAAARSRLNSLMDEEGGSGSKDHNSNMEKTRNHNPNKHGEGSGEKSSVGRSLHRNNGHVRTDLELRITFESDLPSPRSSPRTEQRASSRDLSPVSLPSLPPSLPSPSGDSETAAEDYPMPTKKPRICSVASLNASQEQRYQTVAIQVNFDDAKLTEENRLAQEIIDHLHQKKEMTTRQLQQKLEIARQQIEMNQTLLTVKKDSAMQERMEVLKANSNQLRERMTKKTNLIQKQNELKADNGELTAKLDAMRQQYEGLRQKTVAINRVPHSRLVACLSIQRQYVGVNTAMAMSTSGEGHV